MPLFKHRWFRFPAHPGDPVRLGPVVVLSLMLGLANLYGCTHYQAQSREEKAAALTQVVLPKKPPSKESEAYYHFILR